MESSDKEPTGFTLLRMESPDREIHTGIHRSCQLQHNYSLHR